MRRGQHHWQDQRQDQRQDHYQDHGQDHGKDHGQVQCQDHCHSGQEVKQGLGLSGPYHSIHQSMTLSFSEK